MKHPTLLISIAVFLLAAGLIVFLSRSFSKQPFPPSPQPTPSPIGQISGVQNTQKPQSSPQISSENRDQIRVTKVIDGDTVELENGKRLRYIGIDTPETVDPRTTPQCFGREASAKNKELVEGKIVKLEKDVSETDKYGRLLRYMYVGDTFINDYLVRQGFAHASSYPPDIKYQNQFQEAEREARQNNRGLWATCNSNNASTTNTPNTGCAIKGNISSSGEKIYHMPGQEYYNKTAIDEGKGEKWFCAESDAVESGFRKSKR